MSPAEPYCHACGASVGANRVIELERIDTQADASRAGRMFGAHEVTVASGPAGGASPTPPSVGRRVPTAVAAIAALALLSFGLVLGSSLSSGDGSSATPTTAPASTSPSSTPVDGADDAPTTTGTRRPTTTAPPVSTTVPSYTPEELLQQYARGLAPIPSPPLDDALPYRLAVVDDGGTAHVVDMATGLTDSRLLTVGSFDGANVSEVVGGPHGSIALRAAMTRYGLTDLDHPAPRWVEGRTLVAYDDDTGWMWFGSCFVGPCEHYRRLAGFGPLEGQREDVELPTPTERVVATGGKVYAELAGSVVMIDPATAEREVVAAGQLLDARGTKVVVRSCAIDLECPVYVADVSGATAAVSVRLDGDDIRLAPDGNTLVDGAGRPTQATTLTLIDLTTQRRVDVDADALRFVSMPFRWSPDGDWLFSATATRSIVALRVADGSVQRFSVSGLGRPIAGLVVRDAAVD
jgi:hypothetical protein